MLARHRHGRVPAIRAAGYLKLMLVVAPTGYRAVPGNRCACA